MSAVGTEGNWVYDKYCLTNIVMIYNFYMTKMK